MKVNVKQEGLRMKKRSAILSGLFFVMTMVGLSMASAADQDLKGSKDHPLLSRMPGLYSASLPPSLISFFA